MNDWIEPMLTMRPLVARSCSTKACVTLNTPFKLMAMMSCQSLTTASGSAVEALRRVDAGIVDQTRIVAALARDFCRHHPAGFAVGHIECEGLRLAAGIEDLLRGLGGRIAVHIENDHLSALARVAKRDRAPDARARAG